jgi:RNA polymerase sigma-70 factor (ECF subfamily)
MSVDALSDRPSGPKSERSVAAAARPDRAVIGDQIDRLFRSQAPRLLRFFSRRTGAREDAADLLQETFLRLTRMAATDPIPTSPEAYLQRIASNLLRDRARRSVTHAEDLHGPLDEHALRDCGPGPADRLEVQDLLNQYERALLKLRPKTRTIFLLHRRDSFTYAEIAAQMNLTVSGVEKHMMKAIAHIDRVFGRS